MVRIHSPRPEILITFQTDTAALFGPETAIDQDRCDVPQQEGIAPHADAAPICVEMCRGQPGDPRPPPVWRP